VRGERRARRVQSDAFYLGSTQIDADAHVSPLAREKNCGQFT
jgi:hypothetical protein